jgi:ectoine hydroxylase-related dioxygenase (phytanoyl-CoA dioxygenase family)
MPEIEYIPASAGAEPICEALDRDGACVVENALDAQTLTQLNAELDQMIERASERERASRHPDMEKFYGEHTIRVDGVPAHSDAFVEFMLDPLMHDVCRHVLRPNCDDYILNSTQVIQIGPGETAQRLHRDDEAWPYIEHGGPQLEIEALMALTDFTVENGATQVVPGSHLWEPGRKAEPHEVCQAVMKAGSAVYYLGSTLHGGGANVTEADVRRGMFYGYVVGWLRTAENFFVTVPVERVRELPERVQELLGWKSIGGIGLADTGSPMALLR